MVSSPTQFPLAWPAGIERSKVHTASPFRTGMNQAVASLKDSLRLFGKDTGRQVRGVVISSNVSLGSERPSDPGVAVYFEWDGAQRCIAVDQYRKPEDNLRAIYMILEGRRQEMRYGGLHLVRATFRGFTALPSPDAHWRTVLGLGPEAGLAEVEAAFRTKARALHPDQPTGSDKAMAALTAARMAARAEITG